MYLLIDGYNLLHVTGVFADTVGPRSLERLHAAFLNWLAASLDPDQVARTTVVFDDRGKHAGSRRVQSIAGITTWYASRQEDADTVLAELIREHPAPRQVLVVSSDHQVQRSARRRRAKAIDSEIWYGELMRSSRPSRRRPDVSATDKPAAPLSPHDVNWWLKQFDAELLEELAQADRAAVLPASPSPQAESGSEPLAGSLSAAETVENPGSTELGMDMNMENPFPPEYLAEVQRELERDPQPSEPSSRKRVRKSARRTPRKKGKRE